MNKMLRIIAVLTVAGGFLTPQAGAYIMLLGDCIPNRVAQADVVAFGKITGEEPKKARLGFYPDPELTFKLDVRFFELTISEIVKGKLEPKKVRVGVFDHTQSPKIKVDDEGCFALSKHYERDFYVLGTGMFFDKAVKEYEKETDFVRRCAKLRNDPEAALHSRVKEDCYLTAYMLVYEYGNAPRRRVTPKVLHKLVEEPIEPKLSQPILQALAEADWSHEKHGVERRQAIHLPHPAVCIPWVKVDAESEKTRPRLGFFDDKYEETFRAWFKDNADTIRLQRMVWKESK